MTYMVLTQFKMRYAKTITYMYSAGRKHIAHAASRRQKGYQPILNIIFSKLFVIKAKIAKNHFPIELQRTTFQQLHTFSVPSRLTKSFLLIVWTVIDTLRPEEFKNSYKFLTISSSIYLHLSYHLFDLLLNECQVSI